MTTPTMISTTERRSISRDVAGVEVRAAGDSAPRFVGRALVYNSRAAIGDPKMWGFYEEFAAGAAARTLAEFDQRMLIDHDTYYLVSRVSAGDLVLTDSAAGVDVDSELDEELTYVRDLRRNVEKRRITGMSIGFRIPPGGQRWEEIEVEEPDGAGRVRVFTADLRVITDIDLIEVSAVTFPAFTDTEADLRTVAAALETRGDYAAVARRIDQRPELRSLLDHMTRPPAPPETDTRNGVQSLDRVISVYRSRYPRLRG